MQTWRDLEEQIAASPGKPLALVVDRAGPGSDGDEPHTAPAAGDAATKPNAATGTSVTNATSAGSKEQLAAPVGAQPQQVSLVLTPDTVKTTDMAGRPASIGRAGISLARQAAVVSLTEPTGVAAKAGIKPAIRCSA